MKLSPTSIKHLGDEYSIKNSVYLSTQMAKNPSRIINVLIGDKILKCSFHKDIQKGKIGMSLNIRKYLGLSDSTQPIMVQPYELSPDKQPILSYLQLQIQLVKPKQLIGKRLEINQQQFKSSIYKELSFFFNPEQSKYFTYVINGKELLVSGKTAKCYRVQTGQEKNGQTSKNLISQSGKLTEDTQIKIIGLSGIIVKSTQNSTPSIFRPDFSITDMGIGGLDQELFNIFRRTFASRRYSTEAVKKYGIKHIKGILLYGPPGTGKTLIARQLAKALNVKDLKIVNGPQIFSRYVGESEQNIRKLFAQARTDEQKLGDKSPLHIIVFDEIDAICKQRGMSADTGSQVGDQVVNQLLTNIDGVQSLNNILVIGMTNRKDLIDEAILRPGRFEVHIEIGLPNEQGRLQILQIHTKQLMKNKLIEPKCSLQQLARLTKNFTGAEIQALVKSATSHSICRTTNIMEFQKELVIDEKKIGVMTEDFLKALKQVKPQFGFDQQKFTGYLKQKIINYGQPYMKILNTLESSAEMKDNLPNQKRAILLYGKPGCGKTSLALNFAKHSKFSYIEFITADNLIGMVDNKKVQYISRIFQNAYKTANSCIVIDCMQRIVNYHDIGRRFTNSTLQALLILLQKIPPNESCKLLIIATTSNHDGLSELGLIDRFDTTIRVRDLNENDIATLLESKYSLDQSTCSKIGQALKGISISNLLMLADLVENKINLSQWVFYYENMIKTKKRQIQEENNLNLQDSLY